MARPSRVTRHPGAANNTPAPAGAPCRAHDIAIEAPLLAAARRHRRRAGRASRWRCTPRARCRTRRVSLFDARPVEHDVVARSAHARAVARQRAAAAAPATRGTPKRRSRSSKCTSRNSRRRGRGFGGLAHDAELRIRAIDEARADARRGAELRRSSSRRCRRAWLAACAREPQRLHTRFGTPVAALKPVARRASRSTPAWSTTHDLAVVAEGGVFAEAGAQGDQRTTTGRPRGSAR